VDEGRGERQPGSVGVERRIVWLTKGKEEAQRWQSGERECRSGEVE
jgi:hypothetical protein